MSSDRRLAKLAELQAQHAASFDICPVQACHMGADANIYRALVVGPDGNQRAVRGCVKHLGLQVEQALSQIRLEPFD